MSHLVFEFPYLLLVGKSMGTHKYARRTSILIPKTNYIPSNIYFQAETEKECDL